MDILIKKKLSNSIRSECAYILKHEEDIITKATKLNILFNLQKILDNYDELEPILTEYFNNKAHKEKWNRSER